MEPKQSEFLFYNSPDGQIKLEVLFGDETVWLTQKKMAELFDVEIPTVNYHLKELYESEEISTSATIRNFLIVQKEGAREVEREIKFYNLDAIISVGYRVNSKQATQFRQWATTVLRDFIIKGFVLDDDRLKNGTHFGKDYFKELLERIREIRLSERRLHLQLTDIFALSANYDAQADIAKEFFAFIQNKLHYAITGKTAAEIILDRADKTKPHMGLTTFKLSPDGKVLRTDVTVAKNYLTESELSELRRTVSAFLDIAESRAERGLLTTMEQWIGFMDQYLDLNEYPKLADAGKRSKKQAEIKALKEYDEFHIKQDREYVSEFEKAMKKLNHKESPLL